MVLPLPERGAATTRPAAVMTRTPSVAAAEAAQIVGVVKRALAEILAASAWPTKISARALDRRLLSLRRDRRQRPAQDALVGPGARDRRSRPGSPRHRTGVSSPTTRSSTWIDRWIASVAPVAANATSVSRSRHRRGAAAASASAPATARPPAGSARCRSAAAAAAKEGTPGVTCRGSPARRAAAVCSPIALQIDRSPECSRATSWPSACALGAFRDDLVEAPSARCRRCARRADNVQQRRWHQRAGVEADRAARDQVAAAQR